MKRVHYTDSYLMNPQHPVTVNIIGAGGTGSQVLTGMARLDVTLRALGHPGLFVTVYDPDISLRTMKVITGRMWNVLAKVPSSSYTDNNTPLYWMDFGNTKTAGQVVLGTVPKKIKQPVSTMYETVGSLKVITRFVKYARVKEVDSGPSCSLAEALEKQDLFINSTLAQLGCNILWKMFRHGMIEHHGLFLNLETMKVNPIGV